jgi:hypothetical protein
MTRAADEISPKLLMECRSELERLHAVLRHEPGSFAANRLARVDLALRWITAGYYGRCGICRGRIPDEVLRRTPERLVCGACMRRSAAPEDQAPTTVAPW